MFEAKLLVERGNHRAVSQDWGGFAFLAAPSPGDRIAVWRDGDHHYLTVLSVHHRPVPFPPGKAGDTELQPAAEVVARWTGSENGDKSS